MILFENLFKPRQRRLAQCFELTSSVLSTTSKQCFEQPVTSFLSDALVLIAYNQKEKFSPEKHIE
ncbi:S1 RNA-binding domain-containing protein [Streptococcus pneumoniae]|nr:S1 RNA-binding domain-containing protein [Streptococcus pneumoniae]CIU32763.1 S1 RNA-binding domain-containing protein [Streptococcus pneumoniae]SNL35726.1 S1 RNA-binding domain-containing protein [Streptococcus pneumoniae]